jgi:hypothetical protein
MVVLGALAVVANALSFCECAIKVAKTFVDCMGVWVCERVPASRSPRIDEEGPL